MTSPTISVIMPVRNEVETVAAAISSIAAQDVPGVLEIVVADGMSVDGTRHVLEQLQTVHHNLRVVDNPSGRTAAGLNAAIAASSGDVIVRCDAHSEFPPGYVARAVATLERTGAGNVGGVQRAVGTTPVQRAIAVGMTTPLGVGDARFHRGGAEGPVDTVYLGAFKREVLVEVGGFDESLVRNQDYELNHRIRSAGHAVYFDPALEVTYRPRRTLPGLARQFFQYGGWKRVMVMRNPSSIRWRQLVPPLFVIALGVSLAMAVLGSPRGAIVPALYGGAVLAVSVYEASRRRDLAVLALVAVLPTMHLSWGAGFLLGRSDAEPPRVGSVA